MEKSKYVRNCKSWNHRDSNLELWSSALAFFLRKFDIPDATHSYGSDYSQGHTILKEWC